MRKLSLKNVWFMIIVFSLLLNIKYANAQRIYASSQQPSAAALLCLGCVVTNPANAADGNLQTYSVLNVAVGVAASTYQDLIFSNKPAAGTMVTVKLGTGDKLLSLTALGGVTLQAFNGTAAIGQPVAAATLLTALSNNNELEVGITPTQAYDRIRVSLNGGLLGALSDIYVYEAFYNGTGPGVCNTAVDELHGISSALLGLGANVGGVVNPQNAIDGDITTASTLNAGVGLLGATTQQTVIYNNASVIGDSIRMTLGIPPTLLSAGVLQNISVATYNGNNSNNDSTPLSSALLNLRLLDLTNNIQKVTITFVPSKVFDRVQLTLGGIASVLSTLNLYEAQRLIPSPVVKFAGLATNNANICAGSTATLTATAVPNTVFHWYTAATGGTPVFTGATFTTPALTASTVYYVAAMRNGCTDESQRTKVTVTVNNTPAAPIVANNNVNVCAGQPATFTAQAVTGVTVNWYSAATGGALLFSGNAFTTGPITQTTSFYAEAVAGGTCLSATRTQVTATVVAAPVAPTLASNNISICQGNVAVLSVTNLQAGITYNWYSTSTGGTTLFTGPSFTTPVLNSTTTYFAEAANATGCTSPARTQATVTVVPTPANPTLAANNTTVAAGQTATISVTNAQTGITYNWYTSTNAGTPVFTGSTFTTPALYSTTTYYVAAVNSTGCTSANRTAITINVNVNNNPSCAFAAQQTNDYNAICVGCGVANPANATDADTTNFSTINVLAGLLGGYAEQTFQFQQQGIAGDTIKLVLQSPGTILSAAVLGQIQVIVMNGTNQVASYSLNNPLIRLSLLTGASNRYAIYVPATGPYDRITIRVNSGVVGLLTTLNIFYAEQEFQKPVFSPASPEVCKGSTAQINITSPAAGTFAWYTTPTGGTPVYTGTSFTTPVLNGNTTYYIQYSRGTCADPVRFPVQILVDDAPAAANVTSQNVTVNSGQTATLTGTAANGATVQWYTAATGGTPVATGNTFTTPALTANTTYYAGTATGSCTSTTRTPVTVTVLPVAIPNVTVTPPTIAVDPGATATFTASSTTAGAVFKWYTTATGGTPIYTGATFTTPAEFANVTYYAEATVPSTGAVSATRASGTVIINQTSTNPVACDAAIDQTNSTSGVLCVLCGVVNAGGSVDADRNTFSQLNVPVGLVNAYASQTLRFANPGIAGDSVIVELGIPGSLASVGVLSQIAIATYNGATYNNDRFSVNGSLISITLLNGTSRFRIAFKATAAFDRVEIRLNGSLAGVLNGLNIYDATEEVPVPTVSTASVTVCQNSQATLTATAPADVTIRWYNSATGGSPVATGNTFTTPVLTASTTYYAEASRTADGCVQAIRTPVQVNVSPVPAAPVLSNANVNVCSGQPATFSVQPVSGVTYNWYAAATGGTALATGNSFTTPALTATTTYYVEAEGGGSCSSSVRTPVTATVSATPDNAVVNNANTQACAGSPVTLTATSTQPGVTFNWYTAPTGGTPVFTGAQYTTPALIATTTYYVEVANGSCTSATRTPATVTVNPLPDAPTVTTVPAGGHIASGQTAQITASSTTSGVTYNWYTAASGGTPIFTGATFTTPVLTSNTTYYVEAVSASGCSSSQRTAVTISVDQAISTSCDFASTQTTDVNGGLACVLCSVTNAGNATDADTTTFSTLNLPVSVGGYVSQKLIFGDNGNAGDTVRVKIGLPVSLATVGVLDQIQIASYSGVNGAAYNNDRISISNNAIKLIILPDGQTAIIKFVPSAAFDAIEIRTSATVSVLNSLNIYYASKQVPTPQVAATTVNICAGGTATFIVSNPKADVTYNWYTAAVGGTLVATGTQFTTSALSANTTYYVEAMRTANGCVNPNRVSVNANVTPAPVTPVLAQNAVQICAGDQLTLTVTNAGTSIINWYDAPTGGNLLFTGANFAVSPVATTSYYAEATNGTCTSSLRTVATITVNPRPAAPGVQSATVTVCAGSPATLQVLNPASGINYDWFTTATGGTAVFTGANFNTPAITQNTTYYVQATDPSSGCSNNGSRTQVNVNVTTQPDAPTLSAINTQVCSGGSATLSVVNPVNGMQYSWYTAATGGTPVFTGVTFVLNNLTANASYYVESALASGCTSAGRTETDITVLPVPAAPQVQADSASLSACQGSSISLSITNPQAGNVYRWYDMATGGTLLYTGTQFNTPPLTANTTYYVETAQSGNCNASARTSVTVTVNAMPADPVLANASVQVCPGSSATFTISSPQAGITYQWYDSPNESNKLFTGTTFVTGAITTSTTFYVAAVNATGCTSANLTSAQVSILPPPSAPLLTNASVSTCVNSQVTLSIANPEAGLTYNWYDASSGGTPLYTGTSFTTPVITASTVYYAEAVNTTGCSSVSRTAANVNLAPSPTAPQINAVGQICPGSTAVLTANNSDATITINWYANPTGGTALGTGNTFTTPELTTTTTYYAEAVNSGGCASATRTAVVVNVAQPLAAPSVSVSSTTPESVTFSWNAVPGASSYEVSINGASGSVNVANGTSYTIAGLQPGQSVTVVVRSLGGLSCQISGNSDAVTGTTSNPQGDSIFVPNAFTPNGDGRNDLFQVYGNSIKSVNMWIYDQWGSMLFSSNRQSAGWDGTYKGKAQPVGVYVYYLEATMNDGQIVKKKGTIDLLR